MINFTSSNFTFVKRHAQPDICFVKYNTVHGAAECFSNGIMLIGNIIHTVNRCDEWRKLTYLFPVGAQVKYCTTVGRVTGRTNVLENMKEMEKYEFCVDDSKYTHPLNYSFYSGESVDLLNHR